MRKILRSFTALFAASLLCFGMCSKENKKEEEPQGNKMNVFDLMGNTGKTWTIMRVERTYYNADGKVDSTSTREFTSLDEIMWFSKNFGYSDEKEIYFCRFPLNEFIPENGTWNLDIDAQKLTFICDDLGINCTTAKDGTWEVLNFGKSAYGSSFYIERTLSLANNRKLKVLAKLHADY